MEQTGLPTLLWTVKPNALSGDGLTLIEMKGTCSSALRFTLSRNLTSIEQYIVHVVKFQALMAKHTSHIFILQQIQHDETACSDEISRSDTADTTQYRRRTRILQDTPMILHEATAEAPLVLLLLSHPSITVHP
jgi:hypothetical protein